MKYTDEEVDAVALAILNGDRNVWGLGPARNVSESSGREDYRRRARAALAARDALFEVVGERWEVRYKVRGLECKSDELDGREARSFARNLRDSIDATACATHVTTKRRKR